MSADFILMEGIRMVDEWPIIEKKIPSFDIVFRTVVDPSMIEVGVGGSDDLPGLSGQRRAASSTSKIRLTPDEDRIFRRVDGVKTVQAVIDTTGLGEFEVCRTLFDFLNRNIIVPAGRGQARMAVEQDERGITSATPGYVVVALVLLLAAASVIAQRNTPFAVTGQSSFLGGVYRLVVDDVNLLRLQRLDRGLQAHYLLVGAPARSLGDIVSEGLADASYVKDLSARPFHYVPGWFPSGNGYLLSAVDESGRDRQGFVIERSLP
jgi:hypothetical protein